MENFTQKSYAKINLFLDILNLRSDGYHNIETIFHEIDLYDVINIEINSNNSLESPQITVICDKLSISQEDNIVYKAVKLFCEKFDINHNIKIIIDKNIPSGAGLGGGSSNAACVLNILSDFYKKPDIFEIAVKLGADVPFFLKGGTAIGRGIGEDLEPLNTNKKFIFVLTVPELSVSTEDVYKQLDNLGFVSGFEDKSKLTQTGECDILATALLQENPEIIVEKLYNRLEEPAFFLYPELKNIKNRLHEYADKISLMTGSGSAFFSICSDLKKADKLVDFMQKQGFNSIVVTSVVNR
jgi:4-diphosphocytidyl-2-C-methyl-D-erythritol kinase